MKVSAILRMGIVVLIGCGFASAQAPAKGPEAGFGQNRPPFERMLGARDANGRWWNHPALIEKLKLTEDQRKAMDKILLDHKTTLIDLRANVQKAELVMEPLMGEDTPNETKILTQIDKVAQARAELEKANARFLLALRSQLNPEQWKALQAERPERRGLGAEGRGEMRPEGQFREHPQGPPAPPAGGPQSMEQGGPDPAVPAIGGEQLL